MDLKKYLMGIIIIVINKKKFIIGPIQPRFMLLVLPKPATRIKVELICIASLADARSFCVS